MLEKSQNRIYYNNEENSDNIFRAKSQWLKALNLPDKEEILFKLEMNLKGLDRFFNLSNHAFSNFDDLISRDFFEELKIILQGVNRIIIITDELLLEKTKNAFYFQRYILDKLLEDFSRDIHVKQGISQETPEASLHSLRLAFINIRNLISFLDHVSPEVKFIEFNSIGRLISSEIARNKFFNPFDNKPFYPEYDKVLAPRLSEIVFGILWNKMRKKMSVVYLALYRLLHYLEFIDPKDENVQNLKSYLLYFSLINSECKTLLHFLENDFFPFLISLKKPFEVNLSTPNTKNDEIRTFLIQPSNLNGAIQSLTYQLKMELKNVNQRVLKNMISTNIEFRLRGSIENAKGILTNLLQQVIVYISQEFDPEISGEHIFISFISRMKQSRKLRKDIWFFRELMNYFEEKIETDYESNTLDVYKSYFQKLNIYIQKFQIETMILLRYDDALEFQKFFDNIKETRTDDLNTTYVLEAFKLSSKYFKIFLETMFGNISNRSELQGIPLKKSEILKELKAFLEE